MRKRELVIGFVAACTDDFDAMMEVVDVREQEGNGEAPEYLKGLEAFLGKHGRVVNPGVVGAVSKAKVANGVLRAEKIDVLVIHEFTFVLANILAELFDEINVPIVFWNTQDMMEMGPDLNFAQIMINNSVSTMPHGTNYLFQAGRDFEIITGTKDDATASDRFTKLFKALKAKKTVNTLKIGAVGYQYPGMLTISVNEGRLKSSLGVTIEHLDIENIAKAVESISQEQVLSEAEAVRSKYEIRNLNTQDIEQSSKVYLGLKKAIANKELDVLSALCTAMMLNKRIGIAPCYAFSRLLEDEGVQSTCECDIPVAICSALAESITGQAWFTEFYMMDMKEETMLLAHCGYGNLALANPKYPIKAVSHPCYPASQGTGIAFEYSAMPGDVTLLSFTETSSGGYRLIAVEAEALNKEPFTVQCPQFIVKFKNKSLASGVEAFCKAGGTHHLVGCYGNITEELKLAARYLNIEIEVI